MQSPICELTAIEAKDQLVSSDHEGSIAVWSAAHNWEALWRVPASGYVHLLLHSAQQRMCHSPRAPVLPRSSAHRRYRSQCTPRGRGCAPIIEAIRHAPTAVVRFADRDEPCGIETAVLVAVARSLNETKRNERLLLRSSCCSSCVLTASHAHQCECAARLLSPGPSFSLSFSAETLNETKPTASQRPLSQSPLQ